VKQVLQVEKDDAEATSETVDSCNQYVDWIPYHLEQAAARKAAQAQAKLLAESGAAAVEIDAQDFVFES